MSYRLRLIITISLLIALTSGCPLVHYLSISILYLFKLLFC